MLPRPQAGVPSIRDVLPSCLAALGVDGMQNQLSLDEASSIVIVLIDGLGLGNLSDSLGHAPHLRSCMPGVRGLQTVFPSTTATALASWATGRLPGGHGVLGYVVRDPDSGMLVNQLSGLESVADIDGWLHAPALAGSGAARGLDCVVVGLPKFVNSPFTRVVHRGMRYRGAVKLGDRVDMAVNEVRSGANLVVLYVPELDQIGHAHGWKSEAWSAKLEDLDGHLRSLRRALPPMTRTFVTADHGMVDVPTAAHIDFGGPRLSLDGVAAVGGEPRGLQLFLEPTAAVSTVRDAWQEELADRGTVVTQAELKDSGWWVEETPRLLNRGGDLVVIASGLHAFYDASVPQSPSRSMRGQHGALTDIEVEIPWLEI